MTRRRLFVLSSLILLTAAPLGAYLKLGSRVGTRTVTLQWRDFPVRYFITDRGKIIPRRISGNCAAHQRKIGVAVKRARMIALMPFAVTGK